MKTSQANTKNLLELGHFSELEWLDEFDALESTLT